MPAMIDRVDTVSCKEKNGVIRSLTRKARVTGLTVGDEGCGYPALRKALTQLGIPGPGTALASVGDAGYEEWGELVLVDRDVDIVGEDPSTMDVTLVYQHNLDGPNQNIWNPILNNGKLYGKIRCSVQQLTTNFFRNKGVGPKEEIRTQHIWPDDDPDVAYAGKADTQVGEVHVYIPQANMHFEGYIDTDEPQLTAKFFIGIVNKYYWLNEAPRFWLCTEVQWERMRESRYRFGFEFQNNPDGWDPNIVYVDPRTGRPPKNLVDGRGKKIIPYYREVDFDVYLGAYFDGFQVVME